MTNPLFENRPAAAQFLINFEPLGPAGVEISP
jgi:hypothetical protein